jgi:anti-sigma factor ChrR (cupin superfamily)
MSAESPDAQPIDQEVLQALASHAAPQAMAPDERARLREQILTAAAGDGTEVVRVAEGAWQAVLPGVAIRCLRRDPEAGTQTCLWRLEPGARIPAHAHRVDEECMVMSGEIHHRGEIYRSGDYLLARAGTRQHEVLSPQGALLLIRGEIHG